MDRNRSIQELLDEIHKNCTQAKYDVLKEAGYIKEQSEWNSSFFTQIGIFASVVLLAFIGCIFIGHLAKNRHKKLVSLAFGNIDNYQIANNVDLENGQNNNVAKNSEKS